MPLGTTGSLQTDGDGSEYTYAPVPVDKTGALAGKEIVGIAVGSGASFALTKETKAP